MSMQLPLVAARLFETPLAMHEGKAAAIVNALGARILGVSVEMEGPEPLDHVAFSGGRLLERAGRLGDPMGRRMEARGVDALDMLGSVAIIPVEGTLIHKGKWVGASSGETSYEGLQTQIRMARENRDVRAVVFEIDSPGGEVSGAFDTAAMIRALSAEKPTISILTDHAYSAGYLIASAARQIVVPATGGTGSIGMMMLHADKSKALDKAGVKVTVLSAGRFKAQGGPFEPLPDDVAERVRAELENGRRLFAQAVEQGRGARMSMQAALDTEAAMFRGEESVALGLADAMGHSFEAFDEFVASVNKAPRTFHFNNNGAKSMTSPAINAARAAAGSASADHGETFTAAQLEAARADGLAAGHAAGSLEGAKAGAEAERARISAILGHESAKGRTSLANHFAFKTDLAPEAALAALAASAEAASGPSPLAAAMAAAPVANLGPGGERMQPARRTINASDIYARRAEVQRR